MNDDQLERAFHSADPDVRRQAVHRMSLRPSGTSLAQVLEALSDRDWRVRREAIALAAAQTSDRQTMVDELIERVASTNDIGLRNAGIEVLGMIGQGQAERFDAACARADPAGRKFLVEAMGKTRDPKMVPHLEIILRGNDANAAAAAVEALVRIGGDRVEALLMEQLATDDLFLRISVVEGLTRLGTQVPWSALQPAVGDSIVRRISAELLGRTGEPQALEFLLELATDVSPQTSSAGLRAIATLARQAESEREEVVERIAASTGSFRLALHDALLHGDTPTRRGASYLAVLCRDDSSLEAVLQAIADDVVGPEVVDALRAWGPPLVDGLLMFHKAEPRIWSIALELVAELADRYSPQLRPAIRDRIRGLIERDLIDAPDEVKAAAAEGLRWWGDPRDCQTLVACLDSESLSVRAAATRALEFLASRVPGAVEDALRSADFDGPGGADIAQVLSRLDSEGAVEVLKRGLHAGNARTRRAVVQALAIANATDVAQLIGYAIADDDIDVQIAAVRTLGRMSASEANVPLETALASPFAPIRAEAALALGQRDATRAIPRIRELLEDEEPVVVAAALDALAWLQDDVVAEVAERALEDEDVDVFQAGLKAARTLPTRDAERLVTRGLEHPAWNVRMLAVKLLLELDTDTARADLERAWAVESDGMVRHAIEAGLLSGG